MKKLKQVIGSLIIITFVIITLFPILYVAIHSLKGQELITWLYENESVEIWHKVVVKPLYINLDQYYRIFFQTPKFLYMFWNSILITVPIVIIHVIIAVFTAYGFSKMKFPGSEKLFFMYIILMLMPFQVTLVSNYIILDKLNLIDKYAALILPGIFSTFGVFLLKQFMESIDISFIEEARLLGANDFQIVSYIIFPMCRSIVITVAVLIFIDYWGMIEQPLVFISTKEKYPLSVYLGTITSENIGIGFACSILYMVLPILAVIYAQNDLVDGLKITSLK